MRLFIFGAGYSGRAIAREALARGAAVAGTTRSPEKAGALRAEGMQPLLFDGSSLSHEIMTQLATATHLIASAAPDPVDPVLAVAGDVTLKIDGEAAAPWRSHRLARGQKLRIGPCRKGLRFYVAIEGGIACPPVLGSRSTHVRTGIGGIEGRRLKAGDTLPLAQDAVAPGPERGFDPAGLPAAPQRLRVVLGPQDDYFTAAGIKTFLDSDYAVARDADRMGCRLEGPAIEHAKGHNIISDGIPLGGIQVPGNGLPIVLMQDRQTTGGYPKIACLIGPDVARLAQKRPGETVRFVALSLGEAEVAVRAEAARLAELLAGIGPVE